MTPCPRCEHEQDRHTIIDFGCSAIIGDDDDGPMICECERVFGYGDDMPDMSSLATTL